jgi:branched-chain amino acid transport system permease protein
MTTNPFRASGAVLTAIVVAIFAMMPLVLSSYHLEIGTTTLLLIALALAWAIVGGLLGSISLAHSIFVGVGAILAGALRLKLGVNM